MTPGEGFVKSVRRERFVSFFEEDWTQLLFSSDVKVAEPRAEQTHSSSSEANPCNSVPRLCVLCIKKEELTAKMIVISAVHETMLSRRRFDAEGGARGGWKA